MRLVTSGWWRSCRGGWRALRCSTAQSVPNTFQIPPEVSATALPRLQPSRQSSASWPPAGGSSRRGHGGQGSPPALEWGRRLGESLVVVAMADALSCDLPAVQVLLDLQQRRIRWRVLLVPRPGSTPLVLFEKRGKGGRLLHRRLAFWSCLESADFLHPRDQVAGGLIPRCLVERIEALLRGAPLPRRRKEWAQLHGRLVHW